MQVFPHRLDSKVWGVGLGTNESWWSKSLGELCVLFLNFNVIFCGVRGVNVFDCIAICRICVLFEGWLGVAMETGSLLTLGLFCFKMVHLFWIYGGIRFLSC